MSDVIWCLLRLVNGANDTASVCAPIRRRRQHAASWEQQQEQQWGLHLKDIGISWRWTWFVIITLLAHTHAHSHTHSHTCDCQHCNHFYGSFHNLASRVARHKLFDYAHVIFKPLLRCSPFRQFSASPPPPHPHPAPPPAITIHFFIGLSRVCAVIPCGFLLCSTSTL